MAEDELKEYIGCKTSQTEAEICSKCELEKGSAECKRFMNDTKATKIFAHRRK